MFATVLSIMSGALPILGAVWYLSGRLSRQDASLEHMHQCIEMVKEDVKDLKESRRIGFRN